MPKCFQRMTERSLIVKVLQSHVHYQVVPDSTEDYEKGMYVLISVRQTFTVKMSVSMCTYICTECHPGRAAILLMK